MQSDAFSQNMAVQAWLQQERLSLTPSEVAAHSFQLTPSAGVILTKLAVSDRVSFQPIGSSMS